MNEDKWQKKQEYLEEFDKAQGLADRLFAITGWTTNVSLGLLGFLIALLLQLKFNDNLTNTYLNIIPLASLTISLLIGLVLKFIYQAIETLQDYVIMQEEVIERFDLPEKEIKEIRDNQPSEELYDYLLGWKLDHLPTFWMGTQLVFFLTAIITLVIYLINILFY